MSDIVLITSIINQGLHSVILINKRPNLRKMLYYPLYSFISLFAIS